MTTEIKRRVEDQIKGAMRARDKQRRDALRLIMAEFKRVEVDDRIELDDDRALAVLDKMVKQRKESLSQYEKAGRMDLAARESAELEIIREFMPSPLEDEELESLIDRAITQAGAKSMSDMGKVMQIMRPGVQGRADMALVSERVKTRLGAG
jgi:uncharacterized protein YqeY